MQKHPTQHHEKISFPHRGSNEKFHPTQHHENFSSPHRGSNEKFESHKVEELATNVM